MDKLKMQSENLANENVEKIAKLFPNCVTEGKDENGQVTKLVDFDLLKQELSKVVVDGNDERYTLNWAGKKQSILTANSPINATLRPYKEESVGKDGTNGGFDSENLYIEGDNLDVLKLLRETYLNKIKMIYIDPPYNTGSDFVYNDDFASSSEDYLQASKSYDDQGNRMFQNIESNGRFHSDWMSMMYSRLKIAKDLLTENGIIFISIDDCESSNLRKICDEIFGESNFIVEMINITGASQNGEGVKIQKNTESCLVYAKSYDNCIPNKVDKAEESLRNLNDSPSPFITRPEMGYSIYYNPKTGEKLAVKDYDKEKIITNKEELVYKDDAELLSKGFIPIRPGYRNGQLNRWRWGIETFNERKDEIIINKSGNKYGVFFKQSGYNPAKNIMNYTVGTNEIKALFDGNKYFDFPKNTKMIKYLIQIGSNKDSIILDFFSGSATTAHAVMQLNAEDGGNRKFIMVQLPEKCDEKSEAYKAGYKNICEIGKERIRRAGKKIRDDIMSGKILFQEKGKHDPKSEEFKKAMEIAVDNLENNRLDSIYLEEKKLPDIGFRVLKLDSSNMKDVYYSPSDTEQTNLLDLVSNIKEDRSPEDLLFQVMLDMGVILSSEIKTLDIKGKKVFNVNDGNLVCCFDENLTDEVVTEIAKMQPLYAVFRDSSMSSDSVAVNFDQIFETYSPSTTRKVL